MPGLTLDDVNFLLGPQMLEEFEKRLEENPDTLSFMSHPTREMMLASVRKKGDTLQWVPEIERDLELCYEAVKQDPEALAWVPDECMDERLSLEAIKRNPEAWNEISDLYKADRNFRLEAAMANPAVMAWMEEKYLDKNFCEAAMGRNLECLLYGPEAVAKEPIEETGADSDWDSEKHPSHDRWNREILEPDPLRERLPVSEKRPSAADLLDCAYDSMVAMVERDPTLIKHVPEPFLSRFLCEVAETSAQHLQLTDELQKAYEEGMHLHPRLLMHMDEGLITHRMCEIAVLFDKDMISYVPWDFRDRKLYVMEKAGTDRSKEAPRFFRDEPAYRKALPEPDDPLPELEAKPTPSLADDDEPKEREEEPRQSRRVFPTFPGIEFEKHHRDDDDEEVREKQKPKGPRM